MDASTPTKKQMSASFTIYEDDTSEPYPTEKVIG